MDGTVSTDFKEKHEDHESIKIAGFWIFLVQDVLLFATLFATYVVLRNHYAGGPTPKELFDVSGFVAETFILLTSSFTSGIAALQLNRRSVGGLITWEIITVILGLAFIGFEINEFTNMVQEGATVSVSAFLSAFFTLVGTHGAHVTLGIFWMIGLIIQLARHGITPVTSRKISVISLYWHFLDAVWIFIFTVVYLIGVM